MLFRIWLDRMGQQQFEEISNEMQNLHKSMKNLMEIIFATSPLLALSTHGWSTRFIKSTFLLRVSDVLVLFLVLIKERQDIHLPRQQPTSNPHYEFFSLEKTHSLNLGYSHFFHWFIHCFHRGNLFPKKVNFCKLIDKVGNLWNVKESHDMYQFWSSYSAFNLKIFKREANFFIFCVFLNRESRWSHDFSISGTFEISSKKSRDHVITWFGTFSDKQNMLHYTTTKQTDRHLFLSFFLSTTTTAPNASIFFVVCVISYLLSAGASWSSWKSL